MIIFVITSFSCGRDDKEINKLIEEAEKESVKVKADNEDSYGENKNVEDNENGEDNSDGNRECNQNDTQQDNTNNNSSNEEDEEFDATSYEKNTQGDNNADENYTEIENDIYVDDPKKEDENGDHSNVNTKNDSIIPPDEEDEKPYIPELNNLSDLSFSIELFATNNQYHQSAACYGDYAIFVSNYHTEFHMYNLKTRKRLYDLQYTKGTGKDFLGQTLYHCNQATFGVDFYDSSDPFPILYISQHAKENKRYFVEGYRIFPIWDNETNEYSSFSVELVQTIFFPPMTNKNALGTINMIIDPETNKIYTYSRNNNIGLTNSKKCVISCFDIPSSQKKEIFLEDTDILWSFYPGCNASNMQGGCINNGILYIAQGSKSAGYIYLNIIELQSQQQTGRLDLLKNGYTWEPEGCFFYNGHVMLGGGNNIYKVNIQ